MESNSKSFNSYDILYAPTETLTMELIDSLLISKGLGSNSNAYNSKPINKGVLSCYSSFEFNSMLLSSGFKLLESTDKTKKTG